MLPQPFSERKKKKKWKKKNKRSCSGDVRRNRAIRAGKRKWKTLREHTYVWENSWRKVFHHTVCAFTNHRCKPLRTTHLVVNLATFHPKPRDLGSHTSLHLMTFLLCADPEILFFPLHRHCIWWQAVCQWQLPESQQNDVSSRFKHFECPLSPLTVTAPMQGMRPSILFSASRPIHAHNSIWTAKVRDLNCLQCVPSG